MDVYDLIALPVYLALIYFLASVIRSKNVEDPIYQRYFIRGLNYKILGTLGFAGIYLFYYRGGDTVNYYHCIIPLGHLLMAEPEKYFAFLFSANAQYPIECWGEAWIYEVFNLCWGSASIATIKIGSIINLFAFNSFIALTLLHAFISYYFTWKTFTLFAGIYPKLEKQFAIGFLMVPSFIFWGSGIGKDSIMIAAIMGFVYCFYEIVIHKRRIIRNVIVLVICLYIISAIRGFILFTMGPSLILMAAIYYRNMFRSQAVRFVALPVFLLIGVGSSYFYIQNIGSIVSTYNMESLQRKAEGFHSWHTTLGQTTGGSFYSLGNDVDYTVQGIMKKAPVALVITLFGPFFWQIRNPVMLMSGAESLILLYFFIRIFLSIRIYRVFSILFRDHLIMLCLPFIVIMGIAIGMTSFNYGALVRYKIPILPFFIVFLAISNQKIKSNISLLK